jgi:hypothetical protein
MRLHPLEDIACESTGTRATFENDVRSLQVRAMNHLFSQIRGTGNQRACNEGLLDEFCQEGPTKHLDIVANKYITFLKKSLTVLECFCLQVRSMTAPIPVISEKSAPS